MKHRLAFSRILPTTFALAGTLAAASAFGVNYDVKFTSTPPVIDGTIDAVWSTASPAATGFVTTGDINIQSTQQTSVRMLYDQEKLYIMYEATDDAIVANATANDTGFDFATPQDTAEFVLDPSYNQNTTRNDTMYHIVVNPAANAYTYTEAGQNQPAWNLDTGSQTAFGSTGTNWRIEMAIKWTELNSFLTNSPGPVITWPGNGSIWGCQLGRSHSAGNNATYTKWHPTAGSFRQRPIGTLTFQGGPAASGLLLDDYDPIYTTGFENPPFIAGQSIYPIEDWSTSYPLSFTAVTSQFKSGTQSMEMVTTSAGHTISTPITSGSQGIIWLQYACKLSPETTSVASGYRHVLYLSGNYNNASGSATLGSVWFRASTGVGTVQQGGNSLQITQYENPASEGTATNLYFPGIQTFGEWSYVTVKIDERLKTFEVWYNGKKLAQPGRSSVYGVNNRSLFQSFMRAPLYTTNVGGVIPSYFDEYGVYTERVTAAKDWSLYD